MESGTKTYDIYYNNSIDAVFMEWDGYATSEQFKEGTELMLNVLIQNKAVKVLADIKDMVMIGREDQKWLNEFFIPRAVNFGFKAIAILRPDNYFNNVAVESISYKVDKEKLKISFFDDIEDAKKWLGNI